ncbi:hypothetical protein [Microseira sp. BLCC-F43]
MSVGSIVALSSAAASPTDKNLIEMVKKLFAPKAQQQPQPQQKASQVM